MTLDLATLAEMPLDHEPATDKAYRCAEDANVYRIRIVSVAPYADQSAVAVFLRALDLSIVQLDAKNDVMRNEDGSIDIVAATRLTLDQEGWDRQSVADTITMTIRNQIWNAAQVVKAKAALTDALADWGG